MLPQKILQNRCFEIEFKGHFVMKMNEEEQYFFVNEELVICYNYATLKHSKILQLNPLPGSLILQLDHEKKDCVSQKEHNI